MNAAWRDELAAEVLVVGAGAAGLSAALAAAARRVHLICPAPLGEGTATAWAQGGIAAAVGEDDSPALHAEDTLAAGAGLCDPEAVELLTQQGPAAIERLLALGIALDREPSGALARGREAAHRRRRVVHAADATGRELQRILVDAARREARIRTFAGARAETLALAGGRVAGVVVRHRDGSRALHRAPAVILATGGSGRLYRFTTNPEAARGDGLLLAARAGALLADLEFVQFHPTALAGGLDPLPLLTEALRGEGAEIIDERGRRFVFEEHPAGELAPRDVVARAIARQLARGGQALLDGRRAIGEAFPRRFPGVFAVCRKAGLDPRREPVPIAPAAHYQMGGVATDLDGRSSVAGLWAAGEVASTGVHGGNRLASNSLLEAIVFGDRAGRSALDGAARPRAVQAVELVEAPPAPRGQRANASRLEAEVRTTMWDLVGVERHGAGLERAVVALAELRSRAGGTSAAALAELGGLVAQAALARAESRGAHFRRDFPQPATIARRAFCRVDFSRPAPGLLFDATAERRQAVAR